MWKADSLRTMHRVLKGLRRVLVIREKCWVWEFSEEHAEEWGVRSVPVFTCWDIIRGNLDL
jgi:hypothetical protein